MTEQSSSDRLLVAGGGIGGLSCALALAAAGFRVCLLEQAAAFAEVGAGIQMGPNMIYALGQLGLKEGVLADAWMPENLVMRNALDGSEVARIPVTGGFHDIFDEPYAVTHRADLHAPIYKAALAHPAIELRTSCAVETVHGDSEGVTVTLRNGESVRGAALIGADGIWSQVRAHVIGDGDPRVSGHIAYRAVLRREDVPDDLWCPDVVLWGGPKTHFVHYPLRRGELYNLVAVFHSDQYTQSWNEEGDPDELWAHFGGQRPEVWELLQRIETWKFWVLCDRDPRRGWSLGRITLLGDAAHPTLQYLAQGAAMAMEDALCLASELVAADGDPTRAFREYEDKRILRTARLQLTSRFYGDVYHAENVVAELRKELLSRRAPEQAWAGMAWMYGHKEKLVLDRVAAEPITAPAPAR